MLLYLSWIIAGLLVSNLLWILADLRVRLPKEKQDSEYYVRIYMRGLVLAIVLGPLGIIPLVARTIKIGKELDENEVDKNE